MSRCQSRFMGSAFLACSLLLLHTVHSSSAQDGPGRWQALPYDSAGIYVGWDSLGATVNPITHRGELAGGGATHMALLRGSGDASWVLHWAEGRQARLWSV